MAVNEIEMNTSTLSGTIESLERETSQLERQVQTMFQQVQELDQMWTGTAKQVFSQQFQADYQTCKDMCAELKEVVKSFRYARDEYNRCERRVDELVRQLRV